MGKSDHDCALPPLNKTTAPINAARSSNATASNGGAKSVRNLRPISAAVTMDPLPVFQGVPRTAQTMTPTMVIAADPPATSILLGGLDCDISSRCVNIT